MSETGPRLADPDAPVLARLSTLDRFLPVWIGVAMAVGLLLGRAIPGLDSTLSSVEVGSVSLPIAAGLLVMMYPVLAKVRYGEVGTVAADRRLLVSSLLLNWVVGPAVMFALAWLLLPDLPAYRTGLIIVGLARCIAMVLIWNDLAGGDREAAAVLVALNSIFQIVAFAGLGYFYLKVLPGWLGLSTSALSVSVWDIARSVLVFLGIPLVAGFLTRTLGERSRGRAWYEQTFLPRISPIALYGLLFTVVILFALQGHTITSRPGDVARIALPLLAYFAVMFGGSFLLGLRLGLPYPRTATLAFTAAGNNFELAIAVAIGVFGVTSGPSIGRRRRPTDRGSRPRRAGLRGAVGTPALLPPARSGLPACIRGSSVMTDTAAYLPRLRQKRVRHNVADQPGRCCRQRSCLSSTPAPAGRHATGSPSGHSDQEVRRRPARCLRPNPRSLRERRPRSPVRLRAQRRAIPDGRRPARPLRRRQSSRAFGGLGPG